jgi:hypothetical protein
LQEIKEKNEPVEYNRKAKPEYNKFMDILMGEDN